MIPILIPAYKPDENLINLIYSLQSKTSEPIVVIDDGNSLSCSTIFSQLEKTGIHIVRHAVNSGKGRALKTGFNYIALHFKDALGCVTCDADGQHCTDDILAVLDSLKKNPLKLVLGCRIFDSSVPFRSRFGNTITKAVFSFFVGLSISDTQTGLRGIPLALVQECIVISGERYEYETNMLLFCKQKSIQVIEVPIKTIYLENNKSSHFNPIVDSFKIYFLLLRFAISGFFSSILDFVIFFILHSISKNIIFSLLIARLVSLFFNFTINRNFVFKVTESKRNSFLVKYLLLACVLFICSYFGIQFLSKKLLLPVYLSKILVETVLFFTSYTIQREYIFVKKEV